MVSGNFLSLNLTLGSQGLDAKTNVKHNQVASYRTFFTASQEAKRI